MTTGSTVDTNVDTNISINGSEEVGNKPEAPVYYLRPSDNKASLVLDCPSPMLNLDTTIDRIFADIKELNF